MNYSFKLILNLLLVLFLFQGCHTCSEQKTSHRSEDTRKESIQDTIATPNHESLDTHNRKREHSDMPLQSDSVVVLKQKQESILLQEQDFLDKHLEFEEISKSDFTKYQLIYDKGSEPIGDSKGFFYKLGLALESDCNDICETYLVELLSGRKMLLPSNFDAGIIALPFSPSGNQFIAYSLYDLPNYEDYYAYRSEIIAFRIKGKGLDAVKPNFTYHSKDWSIEKLVWIDEHSIALETYDGSVDVPHKYYKAVIK